MYGNTKNRMSDKKIHSLLPTSNGVLNGSSNKPPFYHGNNNNNNNNNNITKILILMINK